jgi:HlyD family secretion protein
VLIKLANPGGVLKPGMNADVEIQIGKRDAVAAVPTAALRADSDIALSAQMLGMDEAELRRQLWPNGKEQPHVDGAGKNVLSLNGREIELPDGVTSESVAALMAKRRSGQELTADERALMRQVFQQSGGVGGARNGGAAGGSASGGRADRGFPGGGGFPPGGFPGGGGIFFSAGGNPQAAPARATNYQFGGDYWVVAVRGDKTVPLAVKTGLTDLEYSEVVAGLQPGDEVLLLPSTSLFEQQERLQQFITQRFGASTPFNQQPRDIPRMFR